LSEYRRVYVDIRKSVDKILEERSDESGIPKKRLIENAIEKLYVPKMDNEKIKKGR